MRSPKQAAAARGARTPAGMRCPALRHGLLAQTTVLENESLTGFAKTLDSHIWRILALQKSGVPNEPEPDAVTALPVNKICPGDPAP